MKSPLERAQHYRELATTFRAIAEAESDAQACSGLLSLADPYERLCDEMLMTGMAANHASNPL